MRHSNIKKAHQLGMPIGTASAKLRKTILFSLVTKLNENICYQCKKKIESIDNFSIEHKVPWLDSENPKELFFSLDNITFSHLSCNISARRDRKPLPTKHGTQWGYRLGCRCNLCKTEKIRTNLKYLKK